MEQVEEPVAWMYELEGDEFSPYLHRYRQPLYACPPHTETPLYATPQPAAVDGLVELRAIATGDHKRGCQGREYTCTCGFDDERDAALAAMSPAGDAEQRGYDRAIAEVVAMLDAYITENPGAEGTFHAKWIKTAIEAGEHKV